jgi:hypothetical protein
MQFLAKRAPPDFAEHLHILLTCEPAAAPFIGSRGCVVCGRFHVKQSSKVVAD